MQSDSRVSQELLAYGAANFIPSFFFCFPSAAALARCEIQVNSGGKTQVGPSLLASALSSQELAEGWKLSKFVFDICLP